MYLENKQCAMAAALSIELGNSLKVLGRCSLRFFSSNLCASGTLNLLSSVSSNYMYIVTEEEEQSLKLAFHFS